jgi:hypothetical protein
MSGFFELIFFMGGIFFIAACIGQICKEGDYDDYD